MDCKYTLVERWYYFLDKDYENIDGMRIDGIIIFILIGLEIISQYLSSTLFKTEYYSNERKK